MSVVCLQTCLTKILGFLEKFRGGFEHDIDDEVEEDKEDEEGDDKITRSRIDHLELGLVVVMYHSEDNDENLVRVALMFLFRCMLCSMLLS
ncbi:hypothetical protein Tco_0204686 [Tanacetum coccineum]